MNTQFLNRLSFRDTYTGPILGENYTEINALIRDFKTRKAYAS